MMSFRILRILLFLAVVSCRPAQKADTIYFNGRIWTGDSDKPWVSSLATRDSLIVYAGNDYRPWMGGTTRTVDLQGAVMLPGFMDDHTHFLSGGYSLAGIHLRQAGSVSEFIEIVRDYCQKHPGDRWILGGDWDHEAWGGELPSRHWIDSVTVGHPLFVTRYDGHMALVNSRALQLAGLSDSTHSPGGGEIVRDPSGAMTGILKDEAMELVNRVIPDPTPGETDEYFQRAQQFALEHGITQVCDMGSYGGWIDLKTYLRARDQNRMHMRVYSFVPLASWKSLDSFCRVNGKGNSQLKWGGCKAFVDGSLGSTTAWFYDPYLDAPDTRGITVTDTADLRRGVLGADKAGLQIAVHAIGDRANDFILGVFEEAEKVNRSRDRRFRIEHAQHLRPEAIPRFAKLSIIASMQPYHAIDDGRWAAKRLDEKRLQGTYAFRSLRDAGARVCFGSDWTVAPLDALTGIYAAVTRETLDGLHPQGWHPEQRISAEDAIRSYTENNAYASFLDHRLGKLQQGMLADMVILDRDPTTVNPDSIPRIRVLETIVNGISMYRKYSYISH